MHLISCKYFADGRLKRKLAVEKGGRQSTIACEQRSTALVGVVGNVAKLF